MPSPIHVFRSITLGFLLVASVTSAASRLPEEGVALGSEIASLKAPRSSNPERQLQLSHLARELLRRPSELHPAHLGELHLQLLDLERLQLQRLIGEVALGAAFAGGRPQADHQLAQAVSIIRKRRGFINHVNYLP